MMEIKAPYLQAIQDIGGKTPGEKQRTINIIARQLTQNVGSEIPHVPEALKPLVDVEVAKNLHQYEGIIAALKSEDITVVSRALQASWFFDGSDSSVINAQYFRENVFPEISLYARLKVIKNFGIYLRNTAVAAEFFLVVTQLYGIDQAVPLLTACEENFAFEMVKENKVVLSERMVATLYRKYPDMVIKYLKLSKRNDDDARNLYHININDYTEFLPEIANNRFTDFMEIYGMHDGCLNVKLGKKAANVFVKTQADLLVAKPGRYLELVSLKTVTQKLSTENFAEMFKNLYPAKKEDFRYSTLNTYLQYYKPERERVPLLLNTFRLVYGTDLLSCGELVDSDLIKVLPADERVEQARLKLANDKDWHYYDPETSWRCYLPTSESIPAIRQEITKSSDATKRGQLLKQLIYTSKVNDDKNALLKVLNYIYDKHRNDQKYVFYGCIAKICELFDLPTLGADHWEVLNKYIKLAETQDDLANEDSMSSVIEAALHFCLLNDLPFDNYFRILMSMKMEIYHCRWNILTKHLDLERKFMDLFMEVIPQQYPFDSKIWKDKELSIIESLITSLWDFNKHNKNSNSKLKNLFLRNYPWLLEKIKARITNKDDDNHYSISNLLKLIRENERDLYNQLISDLDQFWAFDVQIIADILRIQPERVSQNWRECLEGIRSGFNRTNKQVSSFIARSQWYQDLPIRFFEESLKTFNDPVECVRSIVTLASLTDGDTFAKIIEPYIPTDDKIDTDHPEAKNRYNTLLGIASNLRKVNPPVSLDIIAKFCVGDHLQMAMRSLMSVCRRVPVAKVIPFAKMLTNGRVSVMKHGIRLTYLVASREEIYTVLADLWNKEEHTSIRGVVFTKIYDLFCKQPDARSWRLIRTCLDNLNTHDDDEIFRSLSTLSQVPNEYLCEYIKSVLSAMDSLQEKSEDPSLYVNTSHDIIRNIDGPATKILPEEFTQELIKKYLFVFHDSSLTMETGIQLAVNSYLLASKEYHESRFKFFKDFFKESVEKYWDESYPKCVNFRPMNFVTHKFFARVCNTRNVKFDVRIFESLLDIFQSVLKPIQDAGSYLNLVYIIEYYKSNTAVDCGTRLAQKIPELVEIFSPECVVPIADQLLSFVKYRQFPNSENNQENLLSIVEVFANHGAIHCAFIAARMLFDNKSKELNKRHKAVVHTLSNFRHPGISWFLNEHIATNNFCSGFDED